MKKKQWQKPQLVVLLRSKPEEAVLTGCKVDSPSSTGPTTVADFCLMIDVQACVACLVNVST